jgi:hypothetical protein
VDHDEFDLSDVFDAPARRLRDPTAVSPAKQSNLFDRVARRRRAQARTFQQKLQPSPRPAGSAAATDFDMPGWSTADFATILEVLQPSEVSRACFISSETVEQISEATGMTTLSVGRDFEERGEKCTVKAMSIKVLER